MAYKLSMVPNEVILPYVVPNPIFQEITIQMDAPVENEHTT